MKQEIIPIGTRFTLLVPESEKREYKVYHDTEKLSDLLQTSIVWWEDLDGTEFESVLESDHRFRTLKVTPVNSDLREVLTTMRLNLSWLQRSTPTSKWPTCTCPTSFNCRCGAFIKEMELKGRIYNKWLKAWVTPV